MGKRQFGPPLLEVDCHSRAVCSKAPVDDSKEMGAVVGRATASVKKHAMETSI